MFNKLDLLDLGCDAKHWFWLSFPGDISELSGRNSLSSMKRPIQRFLKHGPWTSSIGILLEIWILTPLSLHSLQDLLRIMEVGPAICFNKSIKWFQSLQNLSTADLV